MVKVNNFTLLADSAAEVFTIKKILTGRDVTFESNRNAGHYIIDVYPCSSSSAQEIIDECITAGEILDAVSIGDLLSDATGGLWIALSEITTNYTEIKKYDVSGAMLSHLKEFGYDDTHPLENTPVYMVACASPDGKAVFIYGEGGVTLQQ